MIKLQHLAMAASMAIPLGTFASPAGADDLMETMRG
jgi:hypothetical protein